MVQSRFVSLRFLIMYHVKSRGVGQPVVAIEQLRATLLELSIISHELSFGGLKVTKYSEKKECLILTNEATMLLKTKDRVYERSQTNPILCVGNPFALGAAYHRHFRSGWRALGVPAGGPTTRSRPCSGRRPYPAGRGRRYIRIPHGGAAESFEASDVTRARRRPLYLPDFEVRKQAWRPSVASTSKRPTDLDETLVDGTRILGVSCPTVPIALDWSFQSTVRQI